MNTNSMIYFSRTYGNGNMSGSDDPDGRLPEISTSTSSTEPPSQQLQPQRRSRSHTPSGKRKHRTNRPSDSDTTWNNNNNNKAPTDPQTTTTPTSISTGETVVPRRLPPAPPQHSSTSTSTDKSLPRSMPYYEVPAARMQYQPSSSPAVAMPSQQQQQPSSYQNSPERNAAYQYRTPYTQIDRSRLI
jgi:hypothetical protein